MKQVMIRMFKEASKWLKGNIEIIYSFIYMVISLSALLCQKWTLFWIVIIILLFVLSVFLFNLRKIRKIMKNEGRKRFTIKLENGDIEVKSSQLKQAIIFLSMIEDQLEQGNDENF